MPVTASFKFDDFEARFTWFIFHFPNVFYDFQIEKEKNIVNITVHLEKVIVNFV